MDGSGKPRASGGLGVGPLAFSATLTLLLTGAAAAVAVPALRRGGTSPRLSLLVLALIISTTASVLLARRLDLRASPTTRRSAALGMAAAGATTLATALAEPAITGGAFGSINAFASVVGIGVTLAAWPISGWLTTNDRLRSIAVHVVRRASADDEPPRGAKFSVADWAILSVGAVALLAGLIVVLPSGPFGHDESIYALKAREWIDNTPATGWARYRPLGMSFVGWVVLQFSSSEVWFRFAAVLLSLFTVAVMWLAGKVMYTRVAATLGAAVFMSTETFLRRATEFLNDVIAAGLMLAAMTMIWIHFERSPTRWWIVAAAPLAAGAYYMRYGSALGLVIIALVAAVVWARQLAASWKQLATTAGVLVALLIPHFIHSQTLTGSAFGVFEAARTSVGGGGGGLSDYLRWLPSRLAGPAGTALLAMAGIYAVIIIVASIRGRRGLGPEGRTVAFTVATALLLGLALGAFTHGEPRFLYLPLMLLLLTGARAVSLTWQMLQRTPRMVVGVAAGLVFVAGFTAGVLHMSRAIEGITNSRDVLVEASTAVREDAGGAVCEVRSSYIPQITWYSVCSTSGFTRPLPDGRPAYLMIFENGKRQPVGSDLDGEIAATQGTPLTVIDDPDDKIGDGAVFEYP